MKNANFQFYKADVTVFQTLSISLALPLSNPSQPKIDFYLNPIIFSSKSLQNHFKVCFLKHYFIYVLDFAKINLGFKIGDFLKKGWDS